MADIITQDMVGKTFEEATQDEKVVEEECPYCAAEKIAGKKMSSAEAKVFIEGAK
jgi:predicted metal-binding protein